MGSFLEAPFADELPPQLTTDYKQFYAFDGRAKHEMITDALQKVPSPKRKELVISLWREFLDQPGFERRRLQNRIKGNLLKALLLEYEYTDYFKTVSSDILGENYTSLLAHFVLMQYYDRLENREREGKREERKEKK